MGNSKSELMVEIINKALDLGGAYELDNKRIGHLIKAMAQDQFGKYANMHLKKFNMRIEEKDQEGISQAHEFLGNTFQDFMDKYGNEKIVESLQRWKNDSRG